MWLTGASLSVAGARACCPAMVAFDVRLMDLAGRQHYVVTHDQLRGFGSRAQISHRLSTGLLEGVFGSVYRLSGSPKTWHQQLLAACFATSGVSAASFRARRSCGRFPVERRPSRSPRRATIGPTGRACGDT